MTRNALLHCYRAHIIPTKSRSAMSFYVVMNTFFYTVTVKYCNVRIKRASTVFNLLEISNTTVVCGDNENSSLKPMTGEKKKCKIFSFNEKSMMFTNRTYGFCVNYQTGNVDNYLD